MWCKWGNPPIMQMWLDKAVSRFHYLADPFNVTFKQHVSTLLVGQ